MRKLIGLNAKREYKLSIIGSFYDLDSLGLQKYRLITSKKQQFPPLKASVQEGKGA